MRRADHITPLREMRIVYKFWWRILKGRDYDWDVGLGERIILKLKITASWDVTPFHLVDRYQRFGGAAAFFRVTTER
jgi:hypothetical protein